MFDGFGSSPLDWNWLEGAETRSKGNIRGGERNERCDWWRGEDLMSAASPASRDDGHLNGDWQG